ncbi:GNAT family N-acetyltransferase, partial [Alistipes putredinis]|nr:GNAT family N-acetyltransferase [Alistipes putredinis]
MMLRGHICSLRAVEPQDLELLCRWENDPSLWTVSGTIEPISHYSIEQFIQEQQAGIYRCGQLR